MEYTPERRWPEICRHGYPEVDVPGPQVSGDAGLGRVSKAEDREARQCRSFHGDSERNSRSSGVEERGASYR